MSHHTIRVRYLEEYEYRPWPFEVAHVHTEVLEEADDHDALDSDPGAGHSVAGPDAEDGARPEFRRGECND